MAVSELQTGKNIIAVFDSIFDQTYQQTHPVRETFNTLTAYFYDSGNKSCKVMSKCQHSVTQSYFLNTTLGVHANGL